MLPFLRSLAVSQRPIDRELWLRIATDLMLGADRVGDALGEEFAAQYSRCLDAACAATRLACAQRLSPSMATPKRIIQMLIRRPDAAGCWALAHAPLLPLEDLRRAAADPSRARAVAQRTDLEAELIEGLLESGDLPTLVALAENSEAPIGRRQISRLVERARVGVDVDGSAALAHALLGRTPTTMECAPLFLEASPDQRARILLCAQRAEFARPRTLSIGDAAQALIERLERHAMEGQTAAFDDDLAQALCCPVELARRIAEDPSGEPLVVALAAIRAPADVAVRLLTARDIAEGPDYRRVGALARLQGALGPSAASAVIAAVIGAPASRRPNPPAVDRRASAPGRGGAAAVDSIRQRKAFAEQPAGKIAL